MREYGAMARKLIDRGRKGDLAAINVIADRLDGEPTQAIENADPDEPFRIASRIERAIVKAGGEGEGDGSGNDQ
jgi:hypothetical protein